MVTLFICELKLNEYLLPVGILMHSLINNKDPMTPTRESAN